MSRRTTPLSEALYDYLLEVSLRESDVLRRLREETERLENSDLQISPEQGQFMHMLVGLMGARTALEIGTFTGYSALCVATALPEDGKLIACDIDEEWPSFGRRYWAEAGVAHKIEFRSGPAAKTLERLRAEGAEDSFDFVFIDADKKGLDEYYEHSLRLVRPGGLIAVDNTLWSGKVITPDIFDDATKAIRGFNAKVIDDTRVSLSLVPIGDGLTLLRRE
ncbi:MAG: class I SAM-dependent methyltransferase [Gemmatimonadetes bacterium]|nr:class I SAM-dependent methyltransferase [Gemmatimonadota bacterium]MDA1104136.1 class I SAM-dependent methyltransferase [Gemmatimonadota bacterium]